jgi:hypothetical protein
MNKTQTLDRILADRPAFHRKAETPEGFRASRSALPPKMINYFDTMRGRQDWGISKDFARYLLNVVAPDMITLETGAGISTLIFALGGSKHTAIAPWSDEFEAARDYAEKLEIDMSRVNFIASPSEELLPTLDITDIDIVFIDGMHAFPWPILDWYFTADRLKVGGLMILDDTQLRPVGILSEFLRADMPRWRPVEAIGRTDVFQKIAPAHDVAWHEQPWSVQQRPILERVKGRLARLRGG